MGQAQSPVATEKAEAMGQAQPPVATEKPSCWLFSPPYQGGITQGILFGGQGQDTKFLKKGIFELTGDKIALKKGVFDFIQRKIKTC